MSRSQIETIIYMRQRLNDARAWAKDNIHSEAVYALERGIAAAGKDREIHAGKLYRDLIMLRDGIKSMHPHLFTETGRQALAQQEGK